MTIQVIPNDPIGGGGSGGGGGGGGGGTYPTIGSPANGLSIDGSGVIKLAASTDSVPGAMTAADHVKLTNSVRALADEDSSGFVSWGGSGNYYSYTGGTFTVLRAGAGQIQSVGITWAGGESVGGLVAQKTYYIGYSATNTLVAVDASTIYSASPQTYYENMHTLFSSHVILFTLWTDTVTPVVVVENHPASYPTDISVHDHFRLGQVFVGTGAALSVLSSANATIQSIGEDRIDDHGVDTIVPDSTAVELDVVPIFCDAAGRAIRYNRRVFTYSGVTTVPTAGATYTNNGSTFTVLHTTTAGSAPNRTGTIITWTSAGTSLPQASGNLTKTAGTGDNSIAYSAYASPVGCSSTYVPLSTHVPTPLGTAGATRYGIWAVYVSKSNLQTPNTTTPLPNYLWVPSTTAYNSAANAASSLGTASAPDLAQFVQSIDFLALEPSLNGFVLMDGNTRIIPNETSSGFVAGVRTYKATGAAAFTSGAVAIAAAVNVSTDVTGFTKVNSAADVNAQLALNSINTYFAGNVYPRRITFSLPGPRIVQTDNTNWAILGRAGKFVKAWLQAKTGPTGADFIVDILLSSNNGSTWATIWSTTGNRVKIAANAVSGNSSTFDTATFAAGDIIRIDIAQVGSTIAGSDVTCLLDTATTNV